MLVSTEFFARTEQWVPVHWRDGSWAHEFPDAVVPLPEPDLEHYSRKEDTARDAYFHQYTPEKGDTVMHVGAGRGGKPTCSVRS